MNGLYLSQILLDSRERRIWRVLQSPYRMHAAIMQAFPGQKPHLAGVLFRIEMGQNNIFIPFLVQSRVRPEWNYLIEQYGSAVQLHPVKDISDLKFTQGQQLRFCLRANPIVTKKDNKGRLNKKGKAKTCRLPILIESHQLEWIRKKGLCVRRDKKDGTSVSGGFKVLQCLSINEPAWVHHKQGQKAPIKIGTVIFQGILRVTEPDAFLQNTVIRGIGPAKAFGCGLLSLARA